MNTSVRNHARAEHRCMQGNYHRCRGDCWGCPWHRVGILISADEIDRPFLLTHECTESAEETVLRNELWAFVYHYADSVAKDGALILRMSIMEGLSHREIGRIMKLDHRQIDRKLSRIYAGLRKQKESLL